MKLPAFSYFEIALRSKNISKLEKSHLADFFAGCGVLRQNIVLADLPEKIQAMVYTKSPALCRKIQKAYRRNRQRGWQFRKRILKQHDWYDKWQLEYGPMPLGKKFFLIPTWEKEHAYAKRQHVIHLDPLGASGSGEHPTTQIMIELLEKIAHRLPQNASCLDLGTGTGILGIAAAKLRPDLSITAVDNDRMAVKSTYFNFKLNQIQNYKVVRKNLLSPCPSLRGREAAEAISEFGDRHGCLWQPRDDKKGKGHYDLVLANLISSVLEAIQPSLFSSVKKGGYLLVSGIHHQNFFDFHSRFRHPDFRCLAISKKRGWSGLLYRF